jgi:hypothetical protein
VRVLDAGTRLLRTAASFVNDFAPRRRADRERLEALLVEQRAWARTASEAYDRVTGEVPEDSLRILFVRAKLQAIRHEELLAQMLAQLGMGRRRDERVPTLALDLPRGGREDGGREALVRALAAATVACEGWRALTEIGAAAESEALSRALLGASQAIGNQPEEQRQLASDALLVCTVEQALR